MKQRFEKREELAEGKVIYDMEIARRPSPSLAALVLQAKDEIDRTSTEYLHEQLTKARADENVLLHDAIYEAFTPAKLYSEIVKKVYNVLRGAYRKTPFRVAYAQVRNNELRINHSIAEETADHPSHAISLINEEPYTAKLACQNGEAVYVASTKIEMEKSMEERRFAKTYEEQDLNILASIACIPVSSSARQSDESNVHGVLCIDTSINGFFSDARAQALEASLKSLVIELSLAEMMDGMLKHFRQ